MDSYPLWLIWLVSGIILAGLELAVPGMVLVFFSLGCFAASALAAVYPESLVAQVAVFGISSILFLVLLRRVFLDWFQGETSKKESGGYDDSPDGAIVEASRDFPKSGYGQVRYRGSFWNALSESGEPISEGDSVKIISWTDDRKTAFLVTKSLNK